MALRKRPAGKGRGGMGLKKRPAGTCRYGGVKKALQKKPACKRSCSRDGYQKQKRKERIRKMISYAKLKGGRGQSVKPRSKAYKRIQTVMMEQARRTENLAAEAKADATEAKAEASEAKADASEAKAEAFQAKEASDIAISAANMALSQAKYNKIMIDTFSVFHGEQADPYMGSSIADES